MSVLAAPMKNPVVLHIVDRYLPITENWIYSQLTGVKRYRPVAAAWELENLDIFPYADVYKCSRLLPDSTAVYKKAINKAVESTFKLCTRRRANVARRHKASLLHAHFGATGFDCLPLKKMTGLPLITAFYGQDAYSLPAQSQQWKDRYKKLFEQGDLFLAEGNCMKKTLMSLGCPDEKAVVQHLGVDLETIQFAPRRPSEDGTINIITVGSFREKKGLIYAVKAFALIAHERPSVNLVLVGDGRGPRELEIKSEILQTIEKEHLEDRIRLTGYIQHREFVKEVQNAHIALQPSVMASDGDAEGGAPVCLIEMSASGLPTVATQHCDIPEVIVDGQSGYIVPERDVEAIAERLLYLVDHPETWEAMGNSGREHVKKNYDKRKQAARLEEIYDSIIARV